MKRLTWPIIAIVAVFVLGVVVTLAVSDHAEQQRVIRQQAQTSAAMSITLFLVAVILTVILLAGGVVAGRHWLQGYREREKIRKALQQARVYALLQGARPPTPRRPSMPAQAGGNIVILPGQQRPQPTIEDFRAMIDAMQREGAGRLSSEGMRPPADDWRVL